MAVEVYVIAIFQEGHEPTEEEVREVFEDQWLGDLYSYETEEV